jgi:hypothetical protein
VATFALLGSLRRGSVQYCTVKHLSIFPLNALSSTISMCRRPAVSSETFHGSEARTHGYRCGQFLRVKISSEIGSLCWLLSQLYVDIVNLWQGPLSTCLRNKSKLHSKCTGSYILEIFGILMKVDQHFYSPLYEGRSALLFSADCLTAI